VVWEDCFLQGGIAQAAVTLVSSESSRSGSVCSLHRLRSVTVDGR